jgi:hypothetical protein
LKTFRSRSEQQGANYNVEIDFFSKQAWQFKNLIIATLSFDRIFSFGLRAEVKSFSAIKFCVGLDFAL